MRIAPLLLAAGLFALPAFAQEESAEPQEQFFAPPPGGSDRFRLSGWANFNWRWSEDHIVTTGFPGEPKKLERTVDPGSSASVSVVTLVGDADVIDGVSAHVKIDLIDLYDRNPTSTDHKIDVDQAYVLFGEKYEARILPPGSSLYLLVGKAEKFEKQITRHLETYGLVSTAFNRMEDLQAQIGGSLGPWFYFRAQVSQGNPLFMRDVGVLAGDQGTTLSHDEPPVLETGFPILYDAEVEDLETDSGTTEYGGGLGFRIGRDDGTMNVDFLGFWYERDLADRVELYGSLYGGDLDILSAAGFDLPVEGRRKTEWGANFDARFGPVLLFAQAVHQEVAGLERDGYEAEIALRFDFPPALAIRGSQLFTFIQPVARWSFIDNDFRGPPQFPAPSFWWDWTKYDVGVRLGIVRGVDLTLEYTRNDVEARVPFELDEALATLHVGF